MQKMLFYKLFACILLFAGSISLLEVNWGRNDKKKHGEDFKCKRGNPNLNLINLNMQKISSDSKTTFKDTFVEII